MKRAISILAKLTLSLGTLTCISAQTAPTTSPAATSAAEARVTTQSGLVIITGRKSAGVQVGDRLKVLYTGRLPGGKVFDSTARNADIPVNLTLGETNVIKGWQEGLVGMQIGERRTLIIPPELAFGAEGRGGVVPPNATVEYDIEIVSIERAH